MCEILYVFGIYITLKTNKEMFKHIYKNEIIYEAEIWDIISI